MNECSALSAVVFFLVCCGLAVLAIGGTAVYMMLTEARDERKDNA